MKIVKKTLNVKQYIKKLILTLITPEQTKLKILVMSLRLKKVCRVCYKTYPITELRMHWLIQWHQCLYRYDRVVILLSAVIS